MSVNSFEFYLGGMIRNIYILLLLSLSYSATLLVPDEYFTIQSAIDAAVEGDSVLVSAGTYVENITWPATNGIKLIGSGEDDCIIDGGSLADVEVSVIRFEEDLGEIIDSTTLITGFTIQNGKQWEDANSNNHGGGMYLRDSSPTLTDITFNDNAAQSEGGGMYLIDSNPTLTNVTFSGNSAHWGGGMYLRDSNPTLTNVTFSGNLSTTAGGGGMYLSSSSPTLTDVTFSGNSADDGGGMYLYSSSPTLTDVTFSGNLAIEDDGGGMYLSSSSSPTLTDVTFSGNTADNSGGGMYISSSSPTLTDVTFSGNTANGHGGAINTTNGSDVNISNTLIEGNLSQWSGGGIFQALPSVVRITNTTIINNSASNVGGGIFNNGAIAYVTNSILWNNNAANNAAGEENYAYQAPAVNYVSYSLIDYFSGLGNIFTNPLFCDAENGDFTLSENSPCVGTGQDGADMGAYGVGCEPLIYGCTDPVAANYDPEAILDDGSCEYVPHFIPETGGFPNGAMGIYITDIDIDPGGGCSESIDTDWWWNIFCDSLAVPWMAQDEIAVFDGEICVGSAKNESGADSLQIFVYEDNPNTPEQDGYIEGSELLFKYWHHSTQTELTNLHANYYPNYENEPTIYYFEPFGALNAEFDVYFLNGCTDEEACNYDFATIDDGSCSTMEELGWCDCEGTVIDECGICGGSGMPWGACDCDGNELDCEGVCGGGAIIDECDVCNGDGGNIECWDGSFACDEASCPTPFTGDMNTDGLFNILDVIILLNWILDDEPYIEYGDLNHDGYINIIDIVLLVNWILDGWPPFVTDIDGNVYEIVQIGEQVWMADNLKVTHYNDGSEIPNITNNGEWGGLSSGAYGDYDNNPTNSDNNPTNSETYGRLYNWYTVDDSRGVCPEGWHVPSDEEFMELEMYLGMSESEANGTGWRGTDEGSKLAGNSDLWGDGDLENNSEFGTSGFNGLPAGTRNNNNGSYGGMGIGGYFWSSSENNSNTAWFRSLSYGGTGVSRNGYLKQGGYSIRCLKD